MVRGSERGGGKEGENQVEGIEMYGEREGEGGGGMESEGGM